MKCDRCEYDTDQPQASQRYEGATICPACAVDDRYLTNVEAAIEAWKVVPQDQVGLSAWTCGTIHCFGGWLPHFEHFKKLGVNKSISDGMPKIYVQGDFRYGSEVAHYLFGDSSLFKVRYGIEGNGTDWQIIMRRLEMRRKELIK